MGERAAVSAALFQEGRSRMTAKQLPDDTYLDKIYTESVLFLNVIEYIYNGEIDNARYTANLIADSRLSSVANIEIRKQSDIIDHWAE